GVMAEGTLTYAQAEALIACQWSGIGKQRAFGFGQFLIPEIQSFLPLRPLLKHHSLFNEMLDPSALQTALESLPDSASGQDGVSIGEIRRTTPESLNQLKEELLSGQYQPGKAKTYELPKASGGSRLIQVACAQDRLLQKTAAQVLSKAIDPLLSEACFAYREGYSRERAVQAYRNAWKEGFCYGIKTDIAAFFDSVDRQRLYFLLEALFPREPLIPLIQLWLDHSPTERGLPTGNSLSPVLSNLFLDQFDRKLLAHGLKLIRFADDFLVLFRGSSDSQPTQAFLEQTLAPLKLQLAEHKTEHLSPEAPIRFLGFQLQGGDALVDEPESPVPPDLHWTPLFYQEWEKGRVLYITSQTLQVTLASNDLVLEYGKKQKEAIPWKAIHSLVVVGHPRVSSGVMMRALKENVPVFFQHLNGLPYGQLIPENQTHHANIVAEQRAAFDDLQTRLQWAKAVIHAQVHNRQIMLRRHQVPALWDMTSVQNRIQTCVSLEELRGVEGSCARQFFQEFGKLVEPFEFKGRIYHPPDGPVNSMLSLGYTLLYHRLNAALLRVGLDARTGFFHEGRGTHAALASDLMEEIRYLVERTVLALIHLKAITPADFVASRSNGPLDRLNGDAFRAFIKRFEKSMNSTLQAQEGKPAMAYNAYLDEMAEKTTASIKLKIPYPPRLIR
ncbi:MAG: CRISPR-associated endonuclease Cas1, partial [SAR324 cluster bacterium]|nr:CRISPR-associated endonuclease Cas1 [SAR324 cluster bacterium]